jgi:glutaminyl-peptide cyclotransferase
MRILVPALLLLFTAACQGTPTQPSGTTTASTLGQEPVSYGFRVVAAYPHDPAAFTQGLFWLDGHLYESTGIVGQSTLRRVNLEDGRVLQKIDIPGRVFGEGSTNWGDQIISITWQDGIGYRWDRATFRQLGTFRYPGEGWGLTQNGRELIMSDGSAELRFLNPETFQEIRRVRVTANGQPVAQLNELEFIKGEVWANVWQTPRIARIDPATGNVTGWLDLSALIRDTPGANYDAVLNGIAYDAQRDRLFVTGKNWPRLYEIDVVPASEQR